MGRTPTPAVAVFAIVGILLGITCLFAVVSAVPVSDNVNVTLSLAATTVPVTAAIDLEVDTSLNPADLYCLHADGTIMRVVKDSVSADIIYTVYDHGVSNAASLAIDSFGAMYLLENVVDEAAGTTYARVVVGYINRADEHDGDVDDSARVWYEVMRTAPYPYGVAPGTDAPQLLGLFTEVTVDTDDDHLYLSVSARTDHGEVQDGNGRFPGLREVPLTASVLVVPVYRGDANRTVLVPNDELAIRNLGYRFASGIRRAHHISFAPSGFVEIFACDASGGRSVPDELNVIRKGVHYGFPWRFSDEANPTLDPSYDAAADPLVPPGLQGSFAYDPTFPAAPVGVDFVDPVVNHGPDLITARDPSTGSDAATSSLRSFTYNSEPIALVFDNSNRMNGRFHRKGYVLTRRQGEVVAGGSGALTMIDFSPGNPDTFHTVRISDFTMSAEMMAQGYDHPVDAAVDGNNVYVLEARGNIWRTSFPRTPNSPLPSDGYNVVGVSGSGVGGIVAGVAAAAVAVVAAVAAMLFVRRRRRRRASARGVAGVLDMEVVSSPALAVPSLEDQAAAEDSFGGDDGTALLLP